MIQKQIKNAVNLIVIGVQNCSGRLPVIEANQCGIEVEIGYGEYGELVYEVKIPLKIIENSWPGLTDKKTLLSIGLEIGELQKPEMPKRHMAGGGPGRRGGPGGPEGGGFGDGTKGDMGNMRPPGRQLPSEAGRFSPDSKIFEQTETWMKFGLLDTEE